MIVRSTLLLLAMALPAQAQRGIAVEAVRQLEDELGGPLYRQSWALIVGINKYPPESLFRSLTFAVDDARAVRDLLVRHYGFLAENVVLLLNEQATRDAIEGSFTEMAAKTGKDDRMVFYYSGHGHTADLRRGGKRGFLVPAEVELTQEQLNNAPSLENQCVSMQRLKNLANGTDARHILFLMDACYSGLAISGRSTRGVPDHLKAIAVRPMIGIVTAGQAGEEAFEDPEVGHGYFTKKLLDALEPIHGTILADTQPAEKPDGVITLKELSSYLVSGVARISGGRQNPQEAQEGEGQFLFVPQLASVPAPVRPTPPPVTRPPTRPTPSITPSPSPAVTSANPAGYQFVPIPAGNGVTAFEIGKYEVTVAQFRKFVEVTDYKTTAEKTGKSWGCLDATHSKWDEVPGLNWRHGCSLAERAQDHHPVVHVSQEDARAFCKWIGARLPTDAEWGHAARGGLVGKSYVWGDEWPPPKGVGNFADVTAKRKYTTWSLIDGYDDGFADTAPVGSFKPNAYGLHDMAGNVWEWIEDRGKVRRGGSFYLYSSRIRLRVDCRYRFGTRIPSYAISGFRAARTLGTR